MRSSSTCSRRSSPRPPPLLLTTRFTVSALVAIWCLAALPAHAQLRTRAGGKAAPAKPAGDLELPPSLAPWTSWVLDGEPRAGCPTSAGESLCVWPTSLSASLDPSGGRFAMEVFSEKKGYVRLPGSRARWPLQVRIDGKPAVVLEGPRIWVETGRHRIDGSFRWASLPESLQTPANTGRIQLVVEGKSVARPRRDTDGSLWVQGGREVQRQDDRLDVQVHRRIDDGVPLCVTTRIEISAGGKAREVVLPNAALHGTEAVSLSADIPARLDSDGSLHLQVSAGDHRVEIGAISAAPPDTLQAPKASAPWPGSEIWVWSAYPALRQVELRGAAPVDPARTTLASDWRGLPTFMLAGGTELTLTTKRRGEAEPPPNDVRLSRELWLDVDGRGYTVRDTLSGQMQRDWRLDLAAGDLGHVRVGGEGRVITLHEKQRGVELRQASLGLQAEWRLDDALTDLPAVGWTTDVQNLDAQLRLPPGWTLLGGRGADDIDDTWLGRWDLWAFFFVLLIALAAAKLAGPAWGAVALLTLVLCRHEADAPDLAWMWLLVALALARIDLRGYAKHASRALLYVAVGGMLLTAVPFAVDQIRLALYPQLAGGDGSDARPASAEIFEEEARLAMPDAMEEGVGGAELKAEAPPASPQPSRAARVVKRSKRKSYAMLQSYSRDQEVDPNAVVQTGPGVPDWNLTSHSIRWSGPVQQGERLTLWLISPPLNRGLGLLRVVLLGLLLFGLLRNARGGGSSAGLRAAAAAATAGALVCALTLGGAASAHAQSPATVAPPAELLQELKTRLTRPPPCAPDCISASQLELRVVGAQLQVSAEVHAGAVAAYRAPGPLASWAPDTVTVDGKPAEGTARLKDGFLHVRLAPGLHRIVLSGPIPADALTLQLGTPPHRASVTAEGWDVDGIDEDGHAEGSIRLRRRVRSTDEGTQAQAALPAWLEVRRVFEVGVRWRVRTTVRRLSETGQALLVRFPLLAGESVTQSDVETKAGVALLRMGREAQELSFLSTLEPRDALMLAAPTPRAEAGRWSEVWELACSPLYRCSPDGLAPVQHRADGRYQPVFRPWPGETLRITTERLQAAKGVSATVDAATLELTPGPRMQKANLRLSIRSSSGTTQRISLPKDARLEGVKVGGQPRTAHLKQGSVEVALQPGSRVVEVEWQQPGGILANYETPAVSVGGAAVNARVKVHVPHDRWLLWARGPAWGPAILFWGYLLAAVLLALVLARAPRSPLRTHEWVLLSLGMTQVPVAAAFVVVAWFFAFALRRERSPEGAVAFNFTQLALVGLSFSAAGCLISAVHEGLVVQPDMQVDGAGSHGGQLIWYVDRLGADGSLPRTSVLSIPLWIYKALMLAWALWLASRALRWITWGWTSFSEGGRFRPWREPKPPPNKGGGGSGGGAGRDGGGGPAPKPVNPRQVDTEEIPLGPGEVLPRDLPTEETPLEPEREDTIETPNDKS